MSSKPKPLVHRRMMVLLLVAIGLSAFQPSWAQAPLLLPEAISRELSINVASSDPEFDEAFSREVSLLVTTPEPPARITSELLLSVSPTGETVTLNWSNYNELAQRDLVRYNIFVTEAPFTSVLGITPYATLPAGSNSLTVSNLTAFRDHYFAVVPVDGAGGFNPAVSSTTGYVLAREVISREISILADTEQEGEAVSREVSLLVTTPAPPERINSVGIVASSTGEVVTLNWQTYNELRQQDVVRYDIFLLPGPVQTVAGLTPYTNVPPGTFSLTFSNLTAWHDHYFAVVPVDGGGAFDPVVNYVTSYILAPEAISREISISVSDSSDESAEAFSREVSIVVSTPAVPAPVTGMESGFSVTTSTQDFGALNLDWSTYKEIAQADIRRYRVYAQKEFFNDVSAMQPITNAPPGEPHFILRGLDGGEIYYVAVVAEDFLGQWNPVVHSRSAQSSFAPLGEVQNLNVVSGANSLLFNWSAPVDGLPDLAGYRFYIGPSPTPTFLPSSAQSYEATGLSPATGYAIRITTVSVYNIESAGVSLIAATLLPNPAGLTAQYNGSGVRLSWKHVQPNQLVQHYAIYSSPTPFSSTAGLVPILTTGANHADVPNVPKNPATYFAVTTVNISGGEGSPVATLTPKETGENRATLTLLQDGGIRLVFVAIPGFNYTVQASSDLISWTVIGAAQTGSNGELIFEDHNEFPKDAQFYRLVYP